MYKYMYKIECTAGPCKWDGQINYKITYKIIYKIYYKISYKIYYKINYKLTYTILCEKLYEDTTDFWKNFKIPKFLENNLAHTNSWKKIIRTQRDCVKL